MRVCDVASWLITNHYYRSISNQSEVLNLTPEVGSLSFHQMVKKDQFWQLWNRKNQFLGDKVFSASKSLEKWLWCITTYRGRWWLEYTVILHWKSNWRWWVDNISHGGCDRDELNDKIPSFTLFFTLFRIDISFNLSRILKYESTKGFNTWSSIPGPANSGNHWFPSSRVQMESSWA